MGLNKTNQLWSPRQQDGWRYFQLYNSADQFLFETRSSLSARNVVQPIKVKNIMLQAYNVMKYQLVWSSVYLSETIAQNLVWTLLNLSMRSACLNL